MTTAAIYARVSSARQRDEQTIASQTAALRAHAAAKGFAIPPEWVFEDEGYSGATLIRPALERLRDLAAEVGIPVLLVYAPDRLARRYAYQVLLLEEFARGGTEVRFLQGAKANTPEEELLLQFQGMIAEYERAQIAERTRRGRLHRARAGFASALSGAPYGYRYVRKSDGGEARYEIVESHASVVRELFRRYVEEQGSIYGLTAWLRAQGIPTPQGNSSFWNRGTVWKMLRNPRCSAIPPTAAEQPLASANAPTSRPGPSAGVDARECGERPCARVRPRSGSRSLSRPSCPRNSSSSLSGGSRTTSALRLGAPRCLRCSKDSWPARCAGIAAAAWRVGAAALRECTITTAAWAPTASASNAERSAPIGPCAQTISTTSSGSMSPHCWRSRT
jgi:DNA invertase Pin-like site-specific DNA recombinase